MDQLQLVARASAAEHAEISSQIGEVTGRRCRDQDSRARYGADEHNVGYAAWLLRPQPLGVAVAIRALSKTLATATVVPLSYTSCPRRFHRTSQNRPESFSRLRS